MIKTIIIDDEKHSCDALKMLLAKCCPHVEVFAVCHSGEEGIGKIAELIPHLVFLDIEMPYMNGFQMLEKLPEIKVNPNLIRPLFSNIINNALKYSKAEVTPLIKIYSNTGDHTDKHYCRIFFEDNGIGFDQKYADQIFEMFKRLHPQNEYEGTGIGLALCKKIIEEHGGFISAKGTPGVGSTFVISFPLNVDGKKDNKPDGKKVDENVFSTSNEMAMDPGMALPNPIPPLAG